MILAFSQRVRKLLEKCFYYWCYFYIILVRIIILVLVFGDKVKKNKRRLFYIKQVLEDLENGFIYLLSSLYLFYVAIDFLLLFFKYVSWLSLYLLELQGWIDLMNYIFIFFRIHEWFDFNWVLSCVIYVWSPYIMF